MQNPNRTLLIADELSRHPMDFLRQPVISRTVHPNQQELALAYLRELRQDAFAGDKVLPRLHDLPIGDPFLCESFPFASPLSIQHGYYLFLMKKYFNLFIPESDLDHILELGGGYGNFCRLTCYFGYLKRYVIADLPEMHSLQQHFLGHALPQRVQGGLLDFCSLSDSDIWPNEGLSLFMATFSLSEMPLAMRVEIEKHYEDFNYLFFAYNKSFDGVDNPKYFKQLENKLRNNFHVDHFKDEHRRAWFMLAQRKSK